MHFDWHYALGLLWNADFWRAVGTVVELSLETWLLGIVLGFLVALARQSSRRYLRDAAALYIWFFRSLPLLVLLIFVYNLPQALPSLRPVLSNPFWAGLIALVISETAYLAEIHRGGLLAVDVGQHEAAHALGIRPFGKYRLIVVPQAIRVALPSLGNQFIISLKDTSILVVIGVGELTRTGQEVIAYNFRAFEVWFAVAVIYFVMTFSVAQIIKYMERR